MGRDGIVYVVDSGNHRVQVFSRDGEFLRKWGSKGSGDGQLLFPWGVMVDERGNVYITDTGSVQATRLTNLLLHESTETNSRVQVFSSQGEFLGRLGSRAIHFKLPAGIARDELGNVYVSDWGGSRVQVFKVESP